jgi:hypothetical protein
MDFILKPKVKYEPQKAESLNFLDKGVESSDQVHRLLSYLNPDCAYDEWLKVGMALQSGGYPLTLWDEWSKRGKKYKAGECVEKWSSFSDSGGITMGTLIYWARQSGYCPERYIHSFPQLDSKAVYSNQEAIPLYHWRDLETLPHREYLVKGLIDKGAFSVIYGPSNSGKTFIALDLAFHIAMGKDWCGKRTKQGSVVYIAAEGGIGIRERLAAILLHHEIDYKPDIYIIPTTVSLCGDEPKHQELIERIAAIEDIKLIVVDTLARAIAGGDENSTKDMSELVRNCDIIRQKTGAHIMLVHHSGKDEGRGARGSSALKAAIDTEIRITQSEGTIDAKVEKQREGKTGVINSFRLKPYEVGRDEDGEVITSCALIDMGDKLVSKKALNKQAQRAYDILKDLMADTGPLQIPKKDVEPVQAIKVEDFHERFINAGICSTDKKDSLDKAFSRAMDKLKNEGYIEELNGYVWLTDKTDNNGQT